MGSTAPRKHATKLTAGLAWTTIATRYSVCYTYL